MQRRKGENAVVWRYTKESCTENKIKENKKIPNKYHIIPNNEYGIPYYK